MGQGGELKLGKESFVNRRSKYRRVRGKERGVSGGEQEGYAPNFCFWRGEKKKKKALILWRKCVQCEEFTTGKKRLTGKRKRVTKRVMDTQRDYHSEPGGHAHKEAEKKGRPR